MYERNISNLFCSVIDLSKDNVVLYTPTLASAKLFQYAMLHSQIGTKKCLNKLTIIEKVILMSLETLMHEANDHLHTIRHTSNVKELRRGL